MRVIVLDWFLNFLASANWFFFSYIIFFAQGILSLSTDGVGVPIYRGATIIIAIIYDYMSHNSCSMQICIKHDAGDIRAIIHREKNMKETLCGKLIYSCEI